MAYLLDPTHDPSVLTMSAGNDDPSPRARAAAGRLLSARLRLLRQGKKREAMTQARRAKLKERLHLLTDSITYKEFEEACEPDLPTLPARSAGLSRLQGAQVQREQVVRSMRRHGRNPCSVCGGDYRNNPLSPSLLKRIVQLELDLLPADETVGKRSARMPPARSQMAWSKAVQQGDLDPLPPLSLETLTEFDLRMDRYRDGKWTR